MHSALERMLVAQGLYQKEAAAMVDTWRDSWFEEGLRLFYIVLRSAVDEILPLEINPAPASVARVFVGRIELITPSVVDEVKEAVLRRDRGVLVSTRASCGRLSRASWLRARLPRPSPSSATCRLPTPPSPRRPASASSATDHTDNTDRQTGVRPGQTPSHFATSYTYRVDWSSSGMK